MKKYLELIEGTSSKYWEINLKGKNVIITFGRIGIKNPPSLLKEFGSKDKAKKYAEKKIKEKINKGYLEKNSKTKDASSAPKKIKENLKINDIFKTIYLGDYYTGTAQVGFGDLLERFKNFADIGGGLGGTQENIYSSIKRINFKKCNSVIFHNGADGSYPFFVGVDKNNNIKKIIMEVNVSNYDEGDYDASKEEIHDQFFDKKIKFENVINAKRTKLFNFTLKSGLIAIGHSDYFDGYHSNAISKWKEDKFFMKEGNYQTNYPTGVLNFIYSDETRYEYTKVINFIEPLSILLDESCYPTKYILKDYLTDDYYWDSLKTWKKDFPKLNIKKNAKLNANVLNDKLPHALKILEKQTKILFKDNFKEIFKVRKKELEDFIIGIIQDIEPQELNLPTFGKPKKETKKEKKAFIIERDWIDPFSNMSTNTDTPVQDILHNGYNLNKSFKLDFDNLIMPFNKGSYPVFLHCYSVTGNKKITSQSFGRDDDVTDFVKIVIEDLEGCRLKHTHKDGYCFEKQSK